MRKRTKEKNKSQMFRLFGIFILVQIFLSIPVYGENNQEEKTEDRSVEDLYNLEEKKNSLQSDAGELLESMDSLLNQLNEFEIPDADSIFTPELMQAQETLKADVALLIELLEALKVQLEELMEFAEEAQGYIDQITEIGNTVYAELSSIDPDQMMADAMELAKAQAIEAAKEEFAGLPISDG